MTDRQIKELYQLKYKLINCIFIAYFVNYVQYNYSVCISVCKDKVFG